MIVARRHLCALLLALAPAIASSAPTTFSVATYNVENYLDRNNGNRRAKTAEAQGMVQSNLLAIAPDVLALQEMGSREALRELQSGLQKAGLDLRHSAWIGGWDTNIHVAVLSRFPLVGQQTHTNEVYLLGGRRLHVSRGFAEVDIEVNPDYRFTLLVAHLKSKRRVAVADEAEMRFEEARLLRAVVDRRLAKDPGVNLLVCGDLNDVYNSPAVRQIVGRGRNALRDIRPSERNGDNLTNPSNPAWFPRSVTWTHHFGAEDTYSRIDYILLSPGMTREWDPLETYVFAGANWGLASDHRPIVASFRAADR